ILMADRVDEWLISNLTEFEGKSLQSVAKGELDLDKLDTEEDKKEKEDTNKDFESVLKQMKEVLGEKVSDVRVTNRLTDSPACLVTGDNDMSLNMERIMKEAGQSMSMMGMGGSKPIFEINPAHALVTNIKGEADDERFADITNILFDQAILSEGGQLDDPSAFVHKLNGLLQGLLK
ncbi:MAG: molecular chaperone HtpG, partial [Methylococcaceae bacterium]